MKKWYLITCISASVALVLVIKVNHFISEDRDKTLHFLPVSASICPKHIAKKKCYSINKEGLSHLSILGSGIINYNDFISSYKGDMDKLYVINLTTDNLYYYKNRCLSWYGLKSSEKNLGDIRDSKLKSRIRKYFVRLIYGNPPVKDRRQVITEEELVHQLGAHYFMPLKTETNWPTDVSYVDDLIHFFEKLPPDATLYFHCIHGKGRTTTFIVLYDIFKNYKNVPLEDIVNRHYCMGREDLFDTTVLKNGSWTQEALLARKNFIRFFYDYMKAPDGYGHQPFSRWIKLQNFDQTPIQIHR